MKAFLVISLFMISTIVQAQVQVKGYYRKNGTYVQPHIRSSPDAFKSNNYGSAKSSPLYGSQGGFASPETRDSDLDGIANKYDSDDDNDGIRDEDE